MMESGPEGEITVPEPPLFHSIQIAEEHVSPVAAAEGLSEEERQQQQAQVLSGNLSAMRAVASSGEFCRREVEEMTDTEERGGGGVWGEEQEEGERGRARDLRRRSKNWTVEETQQLIRLRTQIEPRWQKTSKKTELWWEIAEALQRENMLRGEHMFRDARSCSVKWEKLMAGYKDVRDGLKPQKENPFYDELMVLMTGKSTTNMKRERAGTDGDVCSSGQHKEGLTESAAELPQGTVLEGGSPATEKEGLDSAVYEDAEGPSRKRARGEGAEHKSPVADMAAVERTLETFLTRQQNIFREFLESMEEKEQKRQEKEDKWRAEERAQRDLLNNALLVLTHKLVGDPIGVRMPEAPKPAPPVVSSPEIVAKRSNVCRQRDKNWKRAEVLQLIKLRGDMDVRFLKQMRKAPLWEEIGGCLSAQGIKRDGKQCREKWDKLIQEFKDVTEGKRDRRTSVYYAPLIPILGRSEKTQ